jgi:hypothetical protein
MRSLLTLLAAVILTLACAPAFAQEKPGATPDDLNRRFSDTISQRLSDILNPTPSTVAPVKPPFVTPHQPEAVAITTTLTRAAPACAIPLLEAASPTQPVPMPNIVPKEKSLVGVLTPIDRMIFAPHMPSCRSNAGLFSAPTPVAPAMPAANPRSAP